MDLIGKIHPTASMGHNFIVVATYYFTKWVEAVPLKKVQQSVDRNPKENTRGESDPD